MNRPVSRPGPSASGAASCAPPTTGRARPLPPDQRRAAIIAATLPLVGEHGTKVTTRQIAEAAGIAEGTIFRVFPDKEALIKAAVAAALDPSSTLDELNGVDVTMPLRERLTVITEILQRRLIGVFNLLMTLGRHGPPARHPGRAEAEHRTVEGRPGNEAIHRTIVSLLEPDRRRFRYPVEDVVRMVRLLTFSGSHPMISDHNPLTVEQIVSVVLDGVLHHRPAQSAHSAVDPGDHPC